MHIIHPDTILLNIYQRISNESETRWGKNNFWWAKVCAWYTTLVSAVLFLQEKSGAYGHLAALLIFCVVATMWTLIATAAYEEKATATGVDPLELISKGLRTILLISVLFIILIIPIENVWDIMENTLGGAIISFIYFLLCTPSGGKRVRKKAKKRKEDKMAAPSMA